MLADAASPDPWGTVITTYSGYGVIGVTCLVLGIVVWRLWNKDQKDADDSLAREIERTKQEQVRADRAEAARDRAEAANADLNRELREKLIPALIENTRATAELVRFRERADRG